jgi:hypothetical protein
MLKNRIRKLALTAAAITSVTTTILLGATGASATTAAAHRSHAGAAANTVAHASPARPNVSAAYTQVCGTQGEGWSWGVDAGAGNEVAATKFVKQPPGCFDFNLIGYETDTGANDSLEGLYKSGSTWIPGTKGFVSGIPDATSGDWVLLSDVATGTLTKVWSGGQDFIVVDY